MGDQPQTQTRRSILFVLGLLMVAIVALGIAGMLSSFFIAQVNRGMATAINQSGTLRMQSYRVGVALADATVPLAERRERVARLAQEFEQRLTSPRLTDALPSTARDPVRLAYERVRWRWKTEMRRAIDAFLRSASVPDPGADWYLAHVDDFVDDIHSLVHVLEERAEQHIDLLRMIQSIALVLTVAVVLATMFVVAQRVVTPMAELLRAADRARRGDFSGRTRFVGGDELGRLGAALNLMTDGLSQIYNELEDRIAEKTHDLARSNHSLQLLYRTSQALEETPLTERVLHGVLEDLCARLRLAEVVLCLRDADLGACASACISTGSDSGMGAPRKPVVRCADADCALCEGPGLTALETSAENGRHAVASGSVHVVSVPVRVQERQFGLLRVVPYPGRKLEDWQQPLLESVAGHLGTALNLQAWMQESRRLVLHEERSILARELHDSLAQSLSYLKIQTARLDAAVRAAATGESAPRTPPAEILTEIRTGISCAYRQLRELLTTFRLKIDGRGLGSALADTVQEFRERCAIDIVLEDGLPQGLLSPNEEVHVLQIVREALSNVTRHAQARHCAVRLAGGREEVAVSVEDDGAGIPDAAAPRGHYGMAIMRERAASLGGDISIAATPGGGTAVVVRFRPRGIAADSDDGDDAERRGRRTRALEAALKEDV